MQVDDIENYSLYFADRTQVQHTQVPVAGYRGNFTLNQFSQHSVIGREIQGVSQYHTCEIDEVSPALLRCL